MTNNMDAYKRIDTYEEYQFKLNDFIDHLKYIVGKKGQPCPINCMIVSGEKGVGKSHHAENVLDSLKDIKPSLVYKGEISPVELYKLMWENNNAVICLDDVNGILTDKVQGASLLKAATDTKYRRKLYWKKQNPNCIHVDQDNPSDNEEIAIKMKNKVARSGSKKLQSKLENGETFPDAFYFTGAIIILTNKPLSVIDKATEGALSNRSWHQEMLFSVEGAVDLLKHIGDLVVGHKDKDCPDMEPLKKETVDNAVKFLTEDQYVKFYSKYDRIPTFRTLINVAREFQNGNTTISDETIINYTEPRVY